MSQIEWSFSEDVKVATAVIFALTNKIGDAIAICEIMLKNSTRVQTPFACKVHRHSFDRLEFGGDFDQQGFGI